MSEKKKKKEPEAQSEAPETQTETPETPETQAGEPPKEEAAPPETDPRDAALAAKEEQYLRLLAEYDNYRKRTAKEKDAAWSTATGEAVKAFLPVFDNLERALKQETADEAFKKGVEMTMTQLKEVLAKLGLEEIPALGQVFDANLHSAVMHVEDPELGENIIKEVFQAGFKMGDQVIRYAMVVVAN